jgi:hypothetical protein
MKKKAGRPVVTEKRKTRTIKATDTEWQAIQQMAAERGLSASEYIRNVALNSLFFTITETKPLRNPRTMTLVFTDLGGGRIACDSKDHQSMLDAFMGHDEIIYAESDLFDQYDFESDDGCKVIYVKKAGGQCRGF